MKSLTAISIAVVLLGAAGAGGWAITQHGDALAAMVPEREQTIADPVYVGFDPLNIPIIDGNSVSRIVTLEIVLQVDDTTIGDYVIQKAPRLNDAYLGALYGTLTETEGLRNGVVNLPHVKRRLMEVSNAVVGTDKIRDVLVQTVGERPLPH